MVGTSTRVLGAAAIVLAMATMAGCSGAAESAQGGQAGGSADAVTVEDGDKFVARVEGTTVVLHKHVGDAEFPFAREAINGKAILIHPVEGKVEAGLYARVLSVREEGDTFVLETQPLTISEMESVTE